MTLAHWRAPLSIENLVLVVVLVLESKVLYFRGVRAVARKKLQPRRTHGPLYEISRMKSSNIISLIKKIKIDSIW